MGPIDPATGFPEGLTLFYFSDFTNCDGGFCRADSAGTPDSFPRPDVATIEINNIQSATPGNQTFYYHAYLINNNLTYGSWAFRVEVAEPTGALAVCTPKISEISQPCTFDVPIRSTPYNFTLLNNPGSYFYGDIQSGYFSSGSIATVTQINSGSPSFTSGTGLIVGAVKAGH